MNLEYEIEWQRPNGAPIYRYFKLLFTVALRLGLPLEMKAPLNFQMSGTETPDPPYKKRRTYQGSITVNGIKHDDIVFVVDHGETPPGLITFWKKGQPDDKPGTKGGAHPFAELYLGYVRGKTIERKTFSTAEVAKLSAQYNADRNFSIQLWIVNNVPADIGEPAGSDAPIDAPDGKGALLEYLPELQLLNKWRSDVLRSGVPYTNYEVDACVKNVVWGQDERISLEMHWEDGKYVRVKDFGRFDRYASTGERRRVLGYLEKYDGSAARARMILTLKGESDEWTLASATMLRRLANIP